MATNRNYRGRYEGDGGNIAMVSERRRTMDFTKYNKFWVAIAGFALQAVSSFTGFDLAVFGLTPEAVIGFVTAILVYAVPNWPYHKSA
jgi:hypothetical protein